jgi:tetratricopeptide (TPR) repeat protein
LRDAIEKPANYVGLKFEHGIVDTLIKEILGEPAGLPLLQFTLLKLWEGRTRNLVTWEQYDRLGGPRAALEISADELYEKMLPEDQIACQRIFLRLVRPRAESLEVTSNRVRTRSLHDIEDPTRIERVVEKLVKARLLRETKGETSADDQVEVAHEALIRNWRKLIKWLDEDRDTKRQRLRLTGAAESWWAHGKDPGGLVRGSLLQEAEGYKDLNQLEIEFVRASRDFVRRAEAERKAKEDAEASAREAAHHAAVLDAALQKETQARKDADLATRRARWLLVGAVLVALVAVAAFTAALVAWGAAQAAKERAVASKKAADGLIRFMQHDLHDTLGKLGHLELMRTISTQVMKYYENYPPEVGDVGALRERAMALMEQGNLFLAQNNLDSALKSYRDGLAIWERLAKPTDAGSQRDLCYSYERVGDVQRAQVDFAGALKSYRDSLAMRERLTNQDPTNADWQRDLSNSYERIGDVQIAQDDFAGALNSYRDSLAKREKLAKQDSTNTDWQHDLSLSYERIGNVQKAQGDFAGALKSYRDSLAKREKLTKRDSTNADWQRDLSLSYERVGDVQSVQGDLASALKSYRDSLAIREKLAIQDPNNNIRKVDIAFSCWRTGTTLARSDPQSKKEAHSLVERARDILRQLKEQTGLTAQQQGWLDSIEADLQKMQENK